MHDLADVAQRLRTVREAHQRFLALYAVEVAMVQPGLDRVAKDVFDNDADLPDWLPPAGPAIDDGGGASLGW